MVSDVRKKVLCFKRANNYHVINYASGASIGKTLLHGAVVAVRDILYSH